MTGILTGRQSARTGPMSYREAVVEIFKAPYNNDLRYDGARIYKGRKGSDVEKMDTVLFKLQGGPVSVMQLDLVKNTESVLTMDAMKYYDYSLSTVIEIDDRPHYVITFKQKPSVDMPLFLGNLYIETSTYAITEAEFGLIWKTKMPCHRSLLRRNRLECSDSRSCTTGLNIVNRWKMYFAYSRAEVRFR